MENDAFLLPFIGILGVMTVILRPPVGDGLAPHRQGAGFRPFGGRLGIAVLDLGVVGAGGEMRGELVLLRGFLIGLINPGSLVLGLSLLADCVDDERKTTGENREGVFAGVWSALEKLAFAGGPFISGAILSAMGFVESTRGPVALSLVILAKHPSRNA